VRDHRATIPPVGVGIQRPLWSVMIPTFNCARYLHEGLSGVLAQDAGPDQMQIEVVDDHSTHDEPAAVVEALGQGRVTFFRQRENVGHVRNFETCLRHARGRLIHLLHGDDYVRDGFYRRMERAFANADVGAAFCRQIFVDADGHWQGISPLERKESGVLADALEHLATEQRIMTPSIVVRREVYETLGGFDSRLVCSEDWEMWVRIASRYAIWYEVEPLAVYRMHTASNTGRHVRSGADMRYTCRAISIFRSYLPDPIADTVSRKARQTYALSALATAQSLLRQGDVRGGIAQCREALRCCTSPRVLGRVLRLLAPLGRAGARAALPRGRSG
jgi:glycosyltransferase involved in cell wall biosynthesis